MKNLGIVIPLICGLLSFNLVWLVCPVVVNAVSLDAQDYIDIYNNGVSTAEDLYLNDINGNGTTDIDSVITAIICVQKLDVLGWINYITHGELPAVKSQSGTAGFYTIRGETPVKYYMGYMHDAIGEAGEIYYCEHFQVLYQFSNYYPDDVQFLPYNSTYNGYISLGAKLIQKSGNRVEVKYSDPSGNMDSYITHWDNLEVSCSTTMNPNTIPAIAYPSSLITTTSTYCGKGTRVSLPSGDIDIEKPWQYYNTTLLPYLYDLAGGNTDYTKYIVFPTGYTPNQEPTEPPSTFPPLSTELPFPPALLETIVMTDEEGSEYTETVYVTEETGARDRVYQFEVSNLPSLKTATIGKDLLSGEPPDGSILEGMGALWEGVKRILDASKLSTLIPFIATISILIFLLYRIGG